jgi:hypothetical protein
MVGFPQTLNTKADWLNAFKYATSTGDGKATLRARLSLLKQHSKMLVLKKSAKGKNIENRTPDDYELVDDPGAEKIRLGITDTEIDELIGGLI